MMAARHKSPLLHACHPRTLHHPHPRAMPHTHARTQRHPPSRTLLPRTRRPCPASCPPPAAPHTQRRPAPPARGGVGGGGEVIVRRRQGVQTNRAKLAPPLARTCAWSDTPTVATSPSTCAHSWLLAYFRPSTTAWSGRGVARGFCVGPLLTRCSLPPAAIAPQGRQAGGVRQAGQGSRGRTCGKGAGAGLLPQQGGRGRAEAQDAGAEVAQGHCRMSGGGDPKGLWE